ncbi:GH22373 [Drosophila grimshawi]|uniref:GH22373 n=1 Tax=Drosophila grimshawi TaxID=7222 RepID=B4JYV7_DROGR|nr:GH22373 [Drosophila grimshawi]
MIVVRKVLMFAKICSLNFGHGLHMDMFLLTEAKSVDKPVEQDPSPKIDATDDKLESGYTSDASMLTRGLVAMYREVNEDEDKGSNKTTVDVSS